MKENLPDGLLDFRDSITTEAQRRFYVTHQTADDYASVVLAVLKKKGEELLPLTTKEVRGEIQK